MLEILLYVAAGVGVIGTTIKLLQWAGRFGEWCADVKIAMNRAAHYDEQYWRFIKDNDHVWQHYQKEYWKLQAQGKVR